MQVEASESTSVDSRASGDHLCSHGHLANRKGRRRGGGVFEGWGARGEEGGGGGGAHRPLIRSERGRGGGGNW